MSASPAFAPSPRARLLRAIDSLLSPRPAPVATGPLVHDRLAPWLGVLRRLRQLTAPKQPSAQQMRAQFRKDMASLRVGLPIGTVKDQIIGTETGPLPARLYRPQQASEGGTLLVFFHGGGYIMGDLDTHDDACRLLCEASGMPVLAVAYRLAPEHPFPAAFKDGVAAVRWAQGQLARWGVSGLAVGGDSAGGNLAAAVALACAKEGVALRGQLLIYPGTDRTQQRPSYSAFGAGYFLNRVDRELFYGSYLQHNPAHDHDWRVSPLLSAVPATLAPALVVTAGYDMLRDEGQAYAAHLQAGGCRTALLHYPRLGHAFINFVGVHGESHAAVSELARRWRQLLQSA